MNQVSVKEINDIIINTNKSAEKIENASQNLLKLAEEMYESVSKLKY